MLTIKSLVHSYNGQVRIEYPDWEVGKKGHAMILGGSGCGKTTLLHLLGGLMRANEGSISIEGDQLSEMPVSELDRYRGRNIGIIFQKAHLISALNVLENLLLGQYLAKTKTDKKRAASILERLDIGHLKRRKIHELSQGQAQRVSIARALLNEPRLLLADEPTSSLDDANAARVVSLLKEQAAQSGATLIIATHDQRVKGEFKNALKL